MGRPSMRIQPLKHGQRAHHSVRDSPPRSPLRGKRVVGFEQCDVGELSERGSSFRSSPVGRRSPTTRTRSPTFGRRISKSPPRSPTRGTKRGDTSPRGSFHSHQSGSHLRQSPWGSQSGSCSDDDDSPDMSVEVVINRKVGEKLGIKWINHTELAGCVPGSPAAVQGLGEFAGHRATHVNGKPVTTLGEIQRLVQGMKEVCLTLQPPDTTCSASQSDRSPRSLVLRKFSGKSSPKLKSTGVSFRHDTIKSPVFEQRGSTNMWKDIEHRGETMGTMHTQTLETNRSEEPRPLESRPSMEKLLDPKAGSTQTVSLNL